MHQCLRIPEIVSLIFNEISDTHSLPIKDSDSDSSDIDEFRPKNYLAQPRIRGEYSLSETLVQSRSSQLIALAQTCRQLQGPALQILWSSIPCVHILIQCAGNELLKIIQSGYLHRDVGISRSIAPSEADTIKKYASMVRHLHEEKHRCTVVQDAWKALHDTFADTVLFPNLRTIDLTDEVFLFPALFGTSHVKTLIFSSTLRRSSLDFLVGCPNLTSLIIGDFIKPEMLSTIHQALPNWPALSRLDSRTLTPESLQAFSHCPSLRYITFKEIPRDVDWSLAPVGTDPRILYPALEKFVIESDGMPNAAQFLSVFPTTTNLEMLVILNTPPQELEPEEDWLSVLQSVKKYTHSLKELHILDAEVPFLRDKPDLVNSTLSSALLKTLSFHFTALIHIEILYSGNYSFVDEDVKTLTEALPLLKVFQLSLHASSVYVQSSENLYYNPGTSIACLALFVRNCPNLTDLAIMFDAASKEVPEYRSLSPNTVDGSNPWQGMKLTSLDVSISPAGRTDTDNFGAVNRIAEFIHCAFPNLQWMDWEQYKEDDIDDDSPVARQTLVTMAVWSHVSKILREKTRG